MGIAGVLLDDLARQRGGRLRAGATVSFAGWLARGERQRGEGLPVDKARPAISAGAAPALVDNHTERRGLSQQQNPHHALDDGEGNVTRDSVGCLAILAAPRALHKSETPSL